MDKWKQWARAIRRDAHALYLAARDPRVSWLAKAVAIAVAAYALSPIDLIPDFIPVIGYLDDLIIVPLGIWLVVSLIPDEIMVEYRAKADFAPGLHLSLLRKIDGRCCESQTTSNFQPLSLASFAP